MTNCINPNNNTNIYSSDDNNNNNNDARKEKEAEEVRSRRILFELLLQARRSLTKHPLANQSKKHLNIF